jgi:parallel beta-helix repeat protein
MALGAGIGLGFSADGSAATFQVSNLNDSGAGSLRDAIAQANGSTGADTITFQAGLTGAIVLTSGELLISDAVTVSGPGSARLTVSGNHTSRVFDLFNASSHFTASISGLTVTDGAASIGAGVRVADQVLDLDDVAIAGNAAGINGGGLWADGFAMGLSVRNSRISGNTAGDNGGGVYIQDTGAPITFRNTVITGNTATNAGGGVDLYDTDTAILFDRCTVSGNIAGTLGGGIYLYAQNNGDFTVRSSTVSGNSAPSGGGIFIGSLVVPLVIDTSTISGNAATAGNGGGIDAALQGGMTLKNSTIAGNSATGSGGGVFVQNIAPVFLRNMIIGDNVAAADNDLKGPFDAAFSLIESPGSATFSNPVGNILNTDPALGPLTDNGGSTQTRKPVNTSPAVNAGDPAFAVPSASDQRGRARVTNGRIDMGAVEVAPGTLQFGTASVEVAESGGSARLDVTRSGGSDGAVSVNGATADGSALAGSDFVATSAAVGFADGETGPKTIAVPIVDDAQFESAETFSVTLSGATGGAVLGVPASATVTITSDDAASIPVLSTLGGLLLAGLTGIAGLFGFRRGRH